MTPTDQLLVLALVILFTTLAFVLMPRVAAVASELVRGLIGAWRRRLARRPPPARATLRCSPRPDANWWQRVQLDGQPAMLLVSDWQITNACDRPVRLEHAVLRRPRSGRRLLKAVSLAVRNPETHLFGDFALPPGRPVTVVARLWLQPPVCEDGAPFMAGIAFVDSLGYEHPAGELPFVPVTDPSVARALAPEAVDPEARPAATSERERSVPANRARRYPRARVNLETELWTSGGSHPRRCNGRSTVLGLGGAFVEVGERLPPGSLVRMRLRWQDLSDVVCDAIVRSAAMPGGVGVEFLDLSMPDRARIGALVVAQAGKLQA